MTILDLVTGILLMVDLSTFIRLRRACLRYGEPLPVSRYAFLVAGLILIGLGLMPTLSIFKLIGAGALFMDIHLRLIYFQDVVETLWMSRTN